MRIPLPVRLTGALVLGVCWLLCGCGGADGAARPEAMVPGTAPAELGEEMSAAGRGEIEGLLRRGARLEARDRQGLPLLFAAARRGDAEIVALLVNAGADVNAGVGASYDTAKTGYAGTVDGTPMGYAAGAGKIEAMAVLKNAGSNVNGAGPGGTTPLMQASGAGQAEAVQWLLRNGAAAGRDKALALSKMSADPAEKLKKIQKMLVEAGAR